MKRQPEKTGLPTQKQEDGAARTAPSTQFSIILCLAIGLATLAIYLQTRHFDFVRYDDDQYVYLNAMIRAGLTAPGIIQAFGSFYYYNWHPLTTLSYMLDCQLFGLNAGAQHLENVAFHLANAWLLFFALLRMTRQPWRSALVVAVFAVHPLHVESVAWISERKDVLSGFFGMATILLYARYVEAPTARRYLLVILAFALGLMAKSMLVTFPFILLLLDLWPLRRFQWFPPWPILKPFLREKAPLVVIAAGSIVMTFLAQRAGAVISLSQLPLPIRLANAVVAYAGYLAAAFWPVNLAALYPYHLPQAKSVVGAALVLALATVTACVCAKRRPYLLVGWLWYLGMLMPVIGIVQVGSQLMADRYTYLPLVGFLIALVWAAADLVENHRLARHAASVVAGLALLAFTAAAYRQVGYWRNSRALFERALAVTEKNYIMHNNLGLTLAAEGKRSEAMEHYRKAMALNPEYCEPRYNLGHELLQAGKLDDAFSYLNEALRLKKDFPEVHGDLGVLLAARGDFERARMHIEEALRLAPATPTDQSNLCYVLQRLGHFEEAVSRCRDSLRLAPGYLDARFNLGTALASQRKTAEAIEHLSRVIETNPNHPGARAALAQLRIHK